MDIACGITVGYYGIDDGVYPQVHTQKTLLRIQREDNKSFRIRSPTTAPRLNHGDALTTGFSPAASARLRAW